MQRLEDNEEGEGEYVFFFQSSSTWKMGLFPLQKTEFPMGPARSCGGRRRRQSTSRSPSQIDHLIPAAGEEYSLVPPPVHPVDIDLQPAAQLPPYSLARKDAAGELARHLDPGMLKRALAVIAHTTGTLATRSLHPAIPEQWEAGHSLHPSLAALVWCICRRRGAWC